MDSVFIKLLSMSITAGYMILAVIIIRSLFRKAPRWIHCALWGAAALRLVFPFSIESMFSLIPRKEVISPGILNTYLPSAGEGTASAANQTAYGIPLVSGSDAAFRVTDLIQTASVIWFIGMVVLLTYAAVSYIRLRRRVTDARVLEDNIFMSRNIRSPFILGIFKPRIFIHHDIAGEDVRHVIAHEKAHIKRRDHWIKPFGFLLLSVYWFNPLVWAAYVLLCRDIELACDEAVIRRYGEKLKKPYSKALLACSLDRRTIAACPLAFGEISIKRRIKNVLDYRKPAFWIIVAAVAAGILAGVFLLTNPKDKESEQPNPEIPYGTYVFDECIYMNPLSSYYPFDGTGEMYEIIKNGMAVTSIEKGEIISELPFVSKEAVFFTNEEWDELFMFDLGKVDIDGIDYNKRAMRELADEHRIYLMDNEVWLMRLAGKNGVWSVYKLKPYDAKIDAADERVIDFVNPMVNLDDPGALDTVIPSAVFAVNSINNPDRGEIVTQAHTILKKEDRGNEVVLYAMVMYMEFHYADGRLIEKSGSHSPVVITLEKHNGQGYDMKEYWEPADGEGYMASLERMFPEDFDLGLLDTQKYVKSHLRTCYESAVIQSGMDAGARIGQLIDMICSSPAGSSNPHTYVQEHEAEYRELINYGNYTLRHCFSLFEEGNQTGLEGYLMALACSEILETGPAGEDLEYATGQEWYDAYSKLVSIEPDNGN